MTEVIYQRKCKNWIESFMEWTMPRSEAAEHLIKWTGVWTLAAVLRRKVLIGKEYLGSWTCYPYLYIMFVAPPGLRKTTTVGYAIDLMETIPGFPTPPTLITTAALVSDIVNAPESAIYLTVEEFGDLIMKSGDEMFEFLTSMYDGKKALRQKTMMRGVEEAVKPTINMLAGTTPRWIAERMPAAATEGGFASRVIWVYTDKLRQKRMYYTDVEQKHFEDLGVRLIADLIELSKLEGRFKIDKEAQDFMEHWYQNMEHSAASKRLRKYPGYLNRKPVMIHKLAMILHIAYSSELVIYKHDFEEAIKLMETIEADFPKVFQGIGKNEFALEIRDIVRYVEEVGRISEMELTKHFQNIATPARLNELLQGLLQSGDLRTEIGENGKRYFELNDEE